MKNKEQLLHEINKQTGLYLKLSKLFNNKRKFINVELNDSSCESREYRTLQRYAEKYKTIRVEENGFRMVAIFPVK